MKRHDPLWWNCLNYWMCLHGFINMWTKTVCICVSSWDWIIFLSLFLAGNWNCSIPSCKTRRTECYLSKIMYAWYSCAEAVAALFTLSGKWVALYYSNGITVHYAFNVAKPFPSGNKWFKSHPNSISMYSTTIWRKKCLLPQNIFEGSWQTQQCSLLLNSWSRRRLVWT